MLNLAANPQLDAIPPSGVFASADFPNLTTLDIHGTDLRRLQNDTIAGLSEAKKLRSLDISEPAIGFKPHDDVVIGLANFAVDLGAILLYSSTCPAGYYGTTRVGLRENLAVCARCAVGTTKLIVGGSVDDCKLCPYGLEDADTDPTTACVKKKPDLAETRTSSSMAGMYSAIAMGFVVFLLALIIVGYFHRQQQLNMKAHDFSIELEEIRNVLEEANTKASNQIGRQSSSYQTQYSNAPRELKRCHLVLVEIIGSGAFGKVWKAVLDERSTVGTGEYMVAAKTIHMDTKSQDAIGAISELKMEAAMMAQLKSHANVVSLIGVVTRGQPLILVVSFCEHGSLSSFLKRKVKTEKHTSTSTKVSFASDIACGMQHLAESGFVHRDLAARNVLISSTMVAKVADFGLSRATAVSTKRDNGEEEAGEYYRSTKGVFPLRWTAPEAMEKGVYTTQTDVWSFGIVVVEIFEEGRRPYLYSGLSNEAIMSGVLGRTLVHDKPKSMSQGIYDSVVTKCLEFNPSHRPTFAHLAEWFGALEAYKEPSSRPLHSYEYLDTDSETTGAPQSAFARDHGADSHGHCSVSDGPSVEVDINLFGTGRGHSKTSVGAESGPNASGYTERYSDFAFEANRQQAAGYNFLDKSRSAYASASSDYNALPTHNQSIRRATLQEKSFDSVKAIGSNDDDGHDYQSHTTPEATMNLQLPQHLMATSKSSNDDEDSHDYQNCTTTEAIIHTKLSQQSMATSKTNSDDHDSNDYQNCTTSETSIGLQLPQQSMPTLKANCDADDSHDYQHFTTPEASVNTKLSQQFMTTSESTPSVHKAMPWPLPDEQHSHQVVALQTSAKATTEQPQRGKASMKKPQREKYATEVMKTTLQPCQWVGATNCLCKNSPQKGRVFCSWHCCSEPGCLTGCTSIDTYCLEHRARGGRAKNTDKLGGGGFARCAQCHSKLAVCVCNEEEARARARALTARARTEARIGKAHPSKSKSQDARVRAHTATDIGKTLAITLKSLDARGRAHTETNIGKVPKLKSIQPAVVTDSDM
jgi:serine/threonine protein kinase